MCRKELRRAFRIAARYGIQPNIIMPAPLPEPMTQEQLEQFEEEVNDFPADEPQASIRSIDKIRRTTGEWGW